MSNPKWFKYEIIWGKSIASNFLNAKRQPLRIHENICVFCDGQSIYNPQMSAGLPYVDTRKKCERHLSATNQPTLKTPIFNTGERFPKSVIDFENGNFGSQHNTAKPVDLMSYLIKTYTNPGETVLDFTMGSASTGAACLEAGRNFIGIEMDAEYFQVASRRLETIHGRLHGLARKANDTSEDLPLFMEQSR